MEDDCSLEHRVETAYLGQKESKLNVLAIKAKTIQNKAQAYLHVSENTLLSLFDVNIVPAL